MKVTFNQHIGIFEDAVPKEWCEGLMNIFDSNPKHHLDRQSQENNIPTTFKSDNHLSSEVNISSFTQPFLNHFWSTIYPIYNKKYTPDVNPDPYPLFISAFKIQKTLPTEGYHVWHSEFSPVYTDRIMAYTIYLNNVEEGGETEFLHQSLRVKPTQGTLVIWPSGYTHIHRGNPPLSGKKYIVTGWIEWDHKTFKKNNE